MVGVGCSRSTCRSRCISERLDCDIRWMGLSFDVLTLNLEWGEVRFSSFVSLTNGRCRAGGSIFMETIRIMQNGRNANGCGS